MIARRHRPAVGRRAHPTTADAAHSVAASDNAAMSHPTSWRQRAALHWRMTRPGFLLITLTACLLGLATAATAGAMHPGAALVTLLLACMAHAGANVLNDFHDALNGADAVDFKHLPPTLSLQYYFAPDAGFNPFVGAGLNYTLTFSEDSYGPVAGNEVTIGNSWGLAAQVGAVIKIGETMDLVVDARWADIDADVQLNGAEIGTANVDPLVYGLTLGFRF